MVVLLIVFMVIIAIVVITALYLWRPGIASTGPSGGISVSVPKNWKFKAVAESISKQRIVEFVGFTDAELSSPMQVRVFEAPSEIEALRQIRELTGGRVRRYDVEQAVSGKYIMRVLE